jgi:hypothetical protein
VEIRPQNYRLLAERDTCGEVVITHNKMADELFYTRIRKYEVILKDNDILYSGTII